MKTTALLCTLILIFLAGCSHPAKTESDDIRFAIAQAPLNLDPRYATDAASERINRLLYQALIDFDEASHPVPQLANWEVISPIHYRFKLINPGMRTSSPEVLKPSDLNDPPKLQAGDGRTFHNGQRLNAEDVVATYQSLLALKDSAHSSEFANINRVYSNGSDTVDFILHQPDDSFVVKLIVGILPASLIRQHHDFAHQPLGSGPMKFVAWDGNLRLQRVRDKQYLRIVEVKDPTVRVLKLLRGEVDMLQGDLPPELVNHLKQQSDIAVTESPGVNFSYIGINFLDDTLKNPLVRKALAHSIDRQAIINKALVSGSRTANMILPPEHWAGNGNLSMYDYNPQFARRLLLQAGVKLPLKLSYKTSTDAQRVRLATIMQAQMQAAGIQLDIRSLDWGTFFDDIKHGQFQLYGLTWVGIKTPEIYQFAFHSDFVPPKGANRGHFTDHVLDNLLDKHDWTAASSLINQALPYLPLWYEGQFVAVHNGLQGYALKADGNWDGLSRISRTTRP